MTHLSVITDNYTHTERLDMSQENREIVDSNWDRIHKTHYVTGSSNKVTSSYAPVADVDDPRFRLTASYCNPHVDKSGAISLAAAVAEAKQERINFLNDAKRSLEPEFSSHPKLNTIKQKCNDVISSDEMVNVMNDGPSTIKESVDEQAFINYTKQLGKHTAQEALEQKKKTAPKEVAKKIITFPKHLSYEGSVVLCVMLSMNEVAYPHLSNLPIADQTLIRSVISKDISVNFETFEVRFDERKNFVLKFSTPPIYDADGVTLVMLNSVAHPRPEDLHGAGVVPVEKDGDKIEVGGKIVLDKRGIKKLIGVEPIKKNMPNAADPQPEEFQRRQPVSGRNAFEIRADILDMALTYSINSDEDYTPTEIIDIAKKFYAFVENKR